MLTTTGIIVMTGYTLTMLYSVVYDTTRKTSQRIGKALLATGEGILLFQGSVWFLGLSLSAIALSSMMLLLSTEAREVLRDALAEIGAVGDKAVDKAIYTAIVMTSLVVLGLYGVMVTWGIA